MYEISEKQRSAVLAFQISKNGNLSSCCLVIERETTFRNFHGNRRRVVCMISALNNCPIHTPSKKFDNRVSALGKGAALIDMSPRNKFEVPFFSISTQ